MMLVLSGIIVGGFELRSGNYEICRRGANRTFIHRFWQMGSLSSILGRELLAILPVLSFAQFCC